MQQEEIRPTKILAPIIPRTSLWETCWDLT